MRAIIVDAPRVRYVTRHCRHRHSFSERHIACHRNNSYMAASCTAHSVAAGDKKNIRNCHIDNSAVVAVRCRLIRKIERTGHGLRDRGLRDLTHRAVAI